MRKKKNPAAETVRPAASSGPAQAAAPARTSPPAPAKKAAPAAQGYVVIDYPMEGEIVRSSTYAFRIGASPSERVEVSIDGKGWQACRASAGFWWFDWAHYSAGPHSLEARIAGKRALKSMPRQFTVLI